MPSLAELTDYYPQQDNTLPVEQPYLGVPQDADGIRRVYINTAPPAQFPTVAEPITDARPEPMPDVGAGVLEQPFSAGSIVGNRLFGTGGEDRYQTWPEKMIREGLSAPGDVLARTEPSTSESLIEPAMQTAALAGTGGLAGTEEGAVLNATPSLRPALKYGDKIYKAPVGGQHLDALPAHLAEDFQAKAMNGEDINHYNFGFMNHKGQFLDREKALDYAIKEGLVDPSAGQYGALTSTLMADSSKPGAAIEATAKNGSPFYSALEHNINQVSQAKMTGDQWLGTLANKPGVKPEELQWTGTKEFLESKGKEPVTKQELQEHLNNNKVELKEVDKGEADLDKTSPYYNKEIERVLNNDSRGTFDDMHLSLSNDAKAYETLMRKHPELKQDDDWAGTVLNSVVKGSGDTKYHGYQLPGGTSYREKLLTLPSKQERSYGYEWFDPATQKSRAYVTEAEAKANAPAGAIVNKAEIGPTKNPDYRSSHWDEPNILAHVRMNDRMIDGKKSLHIEEIQSDWHQQGRDKGYSDPKKAEQAKAVMEEMKNHKTFSPEWNKLSDKLDTLENDPSGVPDAPFKKSWHELALKRMIREAAEKGYDRLSWTPGEAQAARYDLSKSIDKLTYNPTTGHLQGFKDNRMVLDNPSVPKDKLPDFVGKEASDKILNKPTSKVGVNGSYHTLENADLKIGGEGMKGFYDQIIPKALEKISGQKVKSGQAGEQRTRILDNSGKVINSFDDKATAQRWLDRTFTPETAAKYKVEEKSQPVHYIDIPQSLKDTAMHKGFPLFSAGYMYTPVAGNPFENKK